MEFYTVDTGEYDDYHIVETFTNKRNAQKFASIYGPEYHVRVMSTADEEEKKFLSQKKHYYEVLIHTDSPKELGLDKYPPSMRLISNSQDDIENYNGEGVQDEKYYPKEKYADTFEVEFDKFFDSISFWFYIEAETGRKAIKTAKERISYIKEHKFEFEGLEDFFNSYYAHDKSMADKLLHYNFLTHKNA